MTSEVARQMRYGEINNTMIAVWISRIRIISKWSNIISNCKPDICNTSSDTNVTRVSFLSSADECEIAGGDQACRG